MSNKKTPEGYEVIHRIMRYMNDQRMIAEARVRKDEEAFRDERVPYMMTQRQGDIRKSLQQREKLETEIKACYSVLEKLDRMKEKEEIVKLLKNFSFGKTDEKTFEFLANLSVFNPNQYKGKITQAMGPPPKYEMRATSPVRKYEAVARATSPVRKYETESSARATSPVRKYENPFNVTNASPVRRYQSPDRLNREEAIENLRANVKEMNSQRATSPVKRRKYEAPLTLR